MNHTKKLIHKEFIKVKIKIVKVIIIYSQIIHSKIHKEKGIKNIFLPSLIIIKIKKKKWEIKVLVKKAKKICKNYKRRERFIKQPFKTVYKILIVNKCYPSYSKLQICMEMY